MDVDILGYRNHKEHSDWGQATLSVYSDALRQPLYLGLWLALDSEFKPMFHIFFDRLVTRLSRPNSPDKVTRAQAEIVIENCRIEYKTLRPHCALRCLPPACAIEPGGSPNLVGANAI